MIIDTVNSSLKKMEAEGYIELLNINDKRSKQVSLTEKGLDLANNTVDIIISKENNAFTKYFEITSSPDVFKYIIVGDTLNLSIFKFRSPSSICLFISIFLVLLNCFGISNSTFVVPSVSYLKSSLFSYDVVQT